MWQRQVIGYQKYQNGNGGLSRYTLITTGRVGIYVHMAGAGGLAAGFARAPTVCPAVYAHVVPDEAMKHAICLGRDSWADFPVRHCVDVSPCETVVIFTERESREKQNANLFLTG